MSTCFDLMTRLLESILIAKTLPEALNIVERLRERDVKECLLAYAPVLREPNSPEASSS